MSESYPEVDGMLYAYPDYEPPEKPTYNSAFDETPAGHKLTLQPWPSALLRVASTALHPFVQMSERIGPYEQRQVCAEKALEVWLKLGLEAVLSRSRDTQGYPGDKLCYLTRVFMGAYTARSVRTPLVHEVQKTLHTAAHTTANPSEQRAISRDGTFFLEIEDNTAGLYALAIGDTSYLTAWAVFNRGLYSNAFTYLRDGMDHRLAVYNKHDYDLLSSDTRTLSAAGFHQYGYISHTQRISGQHFIAELRKRSPILHAHFAPQNMSPTPQETLLRLTDIELPNITAKNMLSLAPV